MDNFLKNYTKVTEDSEPKESSKLSLFSPEIVQVSIVWGGTAGFGWAALESMLDGRVSWLLTLAVAVLGFFVSVGVIYLSRR